MNRCTAFVSVLLSSVAFAAPKLSPTLQPKSPRKFFNKDYPLDHAPVTGRHFEFDHPYPAVQDTSDYDRDFVQDENTDGGKWQIQMDYDIVRQKLHQAEKELAELRKKLDEEYSEMEAARKKHNDGVEIEHAAESNRKELQRIADDKRQKVNDGEAKAQAAASKVENEMSDLENCKKALADAKEKLKELLKQRDELKKVSEEKAVAHAKEKERKETEAKKQEEEKRKHEEETKKQEEGMKKQKEEALANKKETVQDGLSKLETKEAYWKKRLASEKQAYNQAASAYEQKLSEVQATQAAFEKAAKELKKFRRPPHVDDDGGVYNVPDKSSAIPYPRFVSIVLAIGMAVMS